MIRRAHPEDLPGLHALETVAFSDPWSLDGLRAELEVRHSRVWVWQDRELAAALLGWLIFEDFHVNRVAVLPHRRREGLGRQLMVRAMHAAQAEGATAVLLEVRADNAAALGLYEALGFVRERVRKGYYHDGTDAVLMRKTLT
jgi:ribosomal-protein-alanine N-acetyltransferase